MCLYLYSFTDLLLCLGSLVSSLMQNCSDPSEQLKLLQSLLLAMTCVLHFFLSLFFSSQCKALGLSIWWRDQIYCSQILRFPAPTEGKDFFGCSEEGINRENGGRFNFLNEQESSAVCAFFQFYFCITY